MENRLERWSCNNFLSSTVPKRAEVSDQKSESKTKELDNFIKAICLKNQKTNQPKKQEKSNKENIFKAEFWGIMPNYISQLDARNCNVTAVDSFCHKMYH